MAARIGLAAALIGLQQAARLVDVAIADVGPPIPKGVPSAGLRAAVDRARDSLAAAVHVCDDELRYLNRLEATAPARLPPEAERVRPGGSAEGLT